MRATNSLFVLATLISATLLGACAAPPAARPAQPAVGAAPAPQDTSTLQDRGWGVVRSPLLGLKLALPEARAWLPDVRRLQVAVFERSSPAPVSSVAAPVRDGLGQTLAAVSVVVPAGSARPQAYAQVVQATALAVSRGLGHRPPRTG